MDAEVTRVPCSPWFNITILFWWIQKKKHHFGKPFKVIDYETLKNCPFHQLLRSSAAWNLHLFGKLWMTWPPLGRRGCLTCTRRESQEINGELWRNISQKDCVCWGVSFDDFVWQKKLLKNPQVSGIHYINLWTLDGQISEPTKLNLLCCDCKVVFPNPLWFRANWPANSKKHLNVSGLLGWYFFLKITTIWGDLG